MIPLLGPASFQCLVRALFDSLKVLFVLTVLAVIAVPNVFYAMLHQTIIKVYYNVIVISHVNKQGRGAFLYCC